MRRTLIPLAVALCATGCSDEIGPHLTAPQQPLGQAPHFLRWAGGVPPQFSTGDADPGDVGPGVVPASWSSMLSLDRYTATFWAVRGQERSVRINYLSSTGETGSPFLRLTDVDPAYVPGRGYLALGDSVLITVSIEPYNVGVSLEPTGLLFRDEAELAIAYGGADGDLNGDGVVDATDDSIESQLLGMWYREGAGAAWMRIPAVQSRWAKSFTSELEHFSEYAVSW